MAVKLLNQLPSKLLLVTLQAVAHHLTLQVLSKLESQIIRQQKTRYQQRVAQKI